jgi:hypothetical protein
MAPNGIVLRAVSMVGVSASPFTFSQQTFEHQGQMWGADINFPTMSRDEAASWVSFLVKLNGRAGTFLLGDPRGASPRGTWAGTPLLQGAHAAQVKTLTVDGFTAGATGKEMDWIQFGSGASSRLHQVVADFTADGSGVASIEIWPALREALSDNTPLVFTNAMGVFRLVSNTREWSIALGQRYSLKLSCMEVL